MPREFALSQRLKSAPVQAFLAVQSLRAPVAPARHSVLVRYKELLRGESGKNLRTTSSDDNLFFDSGSRETVTGRAVRLQGEHHTLFDYDWVFHTVEPRDNRTLMKSQSQAVSELKPEGRHFVCKSEISGFWPE